MFNAFRGLPVGRPRSGVMPSQARPSSTLSPSLEVPQQATRVESDTLLTGADKVFNTDSDSIDFEEGGFNWKGRTFNLGDNRLIRARFERYLASPLPTEDVAELPKHCSAASKSAYK